MPLVIRILNIGSVCILNFWSAWLLRNALTKLRETKISSIWTALSSSQTYNPLFISSGSSLMKLGCITWCLRPLFSTVDPYTVTDGDIHTNIDTNTSTDRETDTDRHGIRKTWTVDGLIQLQMCAELDWLRSYGISVHYSKLTPHIHNIR